VGKLRSCSAAETLELVAAASIPLRATDLPGSQATSRQQPYHAGVRPTLGHLDAHAAAGSVFGPASPWQGVSSQVGGSGKPRQLAGSPAGG